MLHHDRAFLESVQADRRADGRRGGQADTADLERMLHAAAHGDSAAWAAIVERFSSLVRSIGRRHRLAAPDVDDVAQTTWLRLFEHVARVREPNALGGWLATTARHESLRVLARSVRDVPCELELPDTEPAEHSEPESHGAEWRSTIAGAIARLPARQRALMTMLLEEPAPSYAHISATLGMPIGSIGPTRARCMERLSRDPALARLRSELPA
jgi:RNA polymerase sigma factor (sigma-70 family)